METKAQGLQHRTPKLCPFIDATMCRLGPQHRFPLGAMFDLSFVRFFWSAGIALKEVFVLIFCSIRFSSFLRTLLSPCPIVPKVPTKNEAKGPVMRGGGRLWRGLNSTTETSQPLETNPAKDGCWGSRSDYHGAPIEGGGRLRILLPE